MGWGKVKIDAADRAFSLFIRYRDNWTCVKCGRKHPERAGTLGNSHYHSRRHESVRFSPANCDSLCNAPCHGEWGGDKRAEYDAWKERQLGERAFKALMLAANTYCKKDRKLALLYARGLIRQLEKERGIKIL